jgi:hypothetical protein
MTDGLPNCSLFVQFEDSEWDKQDLPSGCDRDQVRDSVERSLWQYNINTQLLRPSCSAKDLRRKVRAARELLKDPALFLPWAAPAEREKLAIQLKAIADTYESEAEDLEAEAAVQSPKGRGRHLTWPLQILINDLIRIWEQAGGNVGGGVEDGVGGPLIRFITYAVRHVEVESTPNMVRHWIRSLKRRDLEWTQLLRHGEI